MQYIRERDRFTASRRTWRLIPDGPEVKGGSPVGIVDAKVFLAEISNQKKN
jgi:hypothetical protein